MDCDTDFRKRFIDELWAEGIATVVAAQHDGSSNAVSAPGCISTAVTVGATISDQGVKPAPHMLLVDLFVPGGPGETSVAVASVTGAWALLRSVLPASGSPHVANRKVYDALVGLRSGTRSEHGQSRLDLFAALRSAVPLINNFGLRAGGWQAGRHPRLIGDVNGDGRTDIVGFGESQVFVALGQGDGTFGESQPALDGLGYGAGGWQVSRNPRRLADVNGDGRVDIVGFGET